MKTDGSGHQDNLMRKRTEMQPGLPRFLLRAMDGPCCPSLRPEAPGIGSLMRLGHVEGKNMENKHHLDNFF